MTRPDAPQGVGESSCHSPGFAAAPAGFVPAPPSGELQAPPWSTPPASPVLESTDAEPVVPERIGRGLVFALGGLVVGVLSAISLRAFEGVLHLNSMKLEFVLAMVPSALMAYVTVWLYAKGAGGAVRRGFVPVVLVLMVGVVAVVTSTLSTDALRTAAKIYPGDLGSQAGWAMSFVTNPAVWIERKVSLLLYVIAAAVGSFGALYGQVKGRL